MGHHEIVAVAYERHLIISKVLSIEEIKRV